MLSEILLAKKLSDERDSSGEPLISADALKVILAAGAILAAFFLWSFIKAHRRSGGAAIIPDEAPFIEWKAQ